MSPIWREVILLTLFNLGVICLAVGGYLLLAPDRFIRMTARLNRWISTDEALSTLDRPRPVDRELYRRHRFVGALATIGGVYILYVFFVWFDRGRVMPGLPVIYNPQASAWIYDSALILLRGIGIFSVISGIAIMIRPSLLKSVETWGNRWVSTDRLARSLDRQKELPEEWFPGRPRLFGIGIIAGSAYILYRCAVGLWGSG